MRALVTGGAGFIGSHLVDRLVARGDEVVVADNLSSGVIGFIQGHIDSGAVVFQNVELKDIDALKPIMVGIDMVYHLAGTIVTYNVLESMRLAGVEKIAFASSSVVYGEGAPMPTPENHGPCLPISLYGASKQAGEGLIGSWVGTFGLQAWIFRFANIIGERGTHGVIFDFIHKLKTDPSRLEVLGDGLQEKSYMEVGDCVDAIIHVIENTNERMNLYNLGSSDTCSVRNIAAIVVRETGCDNASIEYTGGDRGWAGDIPKAMLAINRLKELGFKVNYDSEEAVAHTTRVLIEEIMG